MKQMQKQRKQYARLKAFNALLREVGERRAECGDRERECGRERK